MVVMVVAAMVAVVMPVFNNNDLGICGRC